MEAFRSANEDDAGRFEHVRDVEREPKPLAVPLQELREPRLVEATRPCSSSETRSGDIPNDDLAAELGEAGCRHGADPAGPRTPIGGSIAIRLV